MTRDAAQSADTGADAEGAAAPDGSERELALSRVFDAPRALLYRMWSEPEHVVRWMFPKTFTMIDAGMEFRVGGPYHLKFRHPNGTDYRCGGVYREIVPGARIAFTHAWYDAAGTPGHETLITVTFADEGDGTRLTFHQTLFETVEARDSHAEGWASVLDNLAAYTAGQMPDAAAR